MNRLPLSAVIIGDLNFLVCDENDFMLKKIREDYSLWGKKVERSIILLSLLCYYCLCLSPLDFGVKAFSSLFFF